jgi:hypothetical protein
MRVLEEKAALLHRMAARSRGHTAEHYREDDRGCEKHAETIRNILSESLNRTEEIEEEISGNRD